MNNIAETINHLARVKEYEKAYVIAKQGLEVDPDNSEIVESLMVITKALRAQCMDMAGRKQDYTKTYLEFECLLRNISHLTGQDMYGNQV